MNKEQASKLRTIKFRAHSNADKDLIEKLNRRFHEFCIDAGGVTAVSHRTGYTLGTLKGVRGNSNRMLSPVMAHTLCNMFSGDVPEKYTREYLRPDIAPAQWERLDNIIDDALAL